MRLLVVGGGGREHALCWALHRENPDAIICCAPGNPGTAELATNLAIAADDIDRIADATDMYGIDLVIIGPEVPLALGLADRLRAEGRLVAGPGAAAARIEASKAFSKDVMVAAGIPTAASETFTDLPAALAYVAQQAVETHGWLAPGEMLDGLGMAETTPGPLIMTLQFVGFLAAYREAGWASPLLAGTLGGLLATWVTFAPCFAWIFLGAPFVERLRGNRALSAALAAVSAAVVGVILNVALWFALHVLFREVVPISAWPLSIDLPRPASIDWAAAALSTLALVAVFRLGLGMAPVLAGAATLGIALWATGLA